MKLLSLEPESSASANSAIPAKNGGQGWIRTIEVCDGRFTVCSLWPLGNLPTLFTLFQTELLYYSTDQTFLSIQKQEKNAKKGKEKDNAAKPRCLQPYRQSSMREKQLPCIRD